MPYLDMIVATKIPKAIIRDNVSYIFIVPPPSIFILRGIKAAQCKELPRHRYYTITKHFTKEKSRSSPTGHSGILILIVFIPGVDIYRLQFHHFLLVFGEVFFQNHCFIHKFLEIGF